MNKINPNNDNGRKSDIFPREKSKSDSFVISYKILNNFNDFCN